MAEEGGSGMVTPDTGNLFPRRPLGGRRLQIWNIANPNSPALVANRSLLLGSSSLLGGGLNVGSVDGHAFEVFHSVRTPPDDPNVAVIASERGIGTAIYDTSTKSNPVLLYQDHSGSGVVKEKSAFEVEVLRGGDGRDYAFVAGNLQGAALRVYDVTRARTLTSPCLESRKEPGFSVADEPNGLCSGVHVGSIALGSNIVGNGVSGVGDFVALSRRKLNGLGGGERGFAVYDVSNPASPVLRLSEIPSTRVGGVAMWSQGGSYYVAVHTSGDGRIYDVSCVLGGSCPQGADLVWSQAMSSSSGGRVTVSHSSGTPFLYFAANAESCSVPDQGEWLFEVTDPSSPRDVTPQETISVLGDPTGYWSWYTPEGLQGFNKLIGRQGRFHGTHFFRAARSVVDSHRWVGTAGPVAPEIGGISAGPAAILQCESVVFTAEGVVGGFGGDYDWVLQDQAGSSTGVTDLDGSASFVWNSSDSPILSPGSYRAELTLTNGAGSVACPIECFAGSDLVIVNEPPLLLEALTFTPSCPLSGLTVSCDVNVPGATVFYWDFGDDTQIGPTGNATAQHTYANTTMSYNVTVEVSNCIETQPRVSQAAVVQVTQATVTPTPTPTNTPLPTPTPGACSGASLGCVTPGPSPTPGPTSTPRPPTPTPSGPTPTPSCSGVSLGCITPTPPDGTPTPTTPPGSGNCVETATSLCLSQNRFRVEADFHTGVLPGVGQAVEITPDTGYFWFFNQGNVEVVVKVLDSCGTSFDTFWVFASGLTDVFTTIKVTDTETDAVKLYQNPLGTPFVPIQDTAAFATCGAGDTSIVRTPPLGGRAGGVFASVERELRSLLERFNAPDITSRINVPGGGGGGGSTPTPTPTPTTVPDDPCPTGALCLQDGRFQVSTTWHVPGGASGAGQPAGLTGETGYFSFFDGDNVELVVKVLDGCATAQSAHWVFAAGLTNVEVELSVLDTASGQTRVYTNPLGVPFEAILDTSAFATCSF